LYIHYCVKDGLVEVMILEEFA